MIHGAEKDRDNSFFKSSYSTLAAVIDAIREPFAKNKLSFTQPVRTEADGSVTVETVIMHASGEWISGEITGRPVKNDPQGLGSLITYLKRYGLQAMAGVASKDEDDDGNEASGKTPAHKQPQAKAAATRSQEPAKATPKKEELFEIPFGSHGGDAVFTDISSQRQLLVASCKRHKIVHPVHIAQIARGINGIMVNDLDAGVDEWLLEHKKELSNLPER